MKVRIQNNNNDDDDEDDDADGMYVKQTNKTIL